MRRLAEIFSSTEDIALKSWQILYTSILNFVLCAEKGCHAGAEIGTKFNTQNNTSNASYKVPIAYIIVKLPARIGRTYSWSVIAKEFRGNVNLAIISR